MARRTGWTRLSVTYRKRIVGAGKSGKLAGAPLSEAETRRYWESGQSMQSGRSHSRGAARPKTAAPKKATRLEEQGMGTSESYSQLLEWRNRPPGRGGPPAWIPSDEMEMRTDVAAILSQIDIPPERWERVEMVWLSDTGPIAFQITSTRGAIRTVILPDTQAMQEVGKWLQGLEEDIEVVPSGSPGARDKAA
jgi:hypothetical protein